MGRRKLQAGATGSFRWDNPAETDFPWRYGYYTDTDAPDGWTVPVAPDAPWGPAEVETLRASRAAANRDGRTSDAGGTIELAPGTEYSGLATSLRARGRGGAMDR